jgi:hypothetical protein
MCVRSMHGRLGTGSGRRCGRSARRSNRSLLRFRCCHARRRALAGHPTAPESVAQVSRDALPTKSCAACGRPFAWRKKWRNTWDAVKYCSDGCRGRGASAAASLEETVLAVLRTRAAGATACPSEVARAACGDQWREGIEAVRAAAAALHAQGRIEITQRGVPVDPDGARGPVRLRLVGAVPRGRQRRR